MHVTHVLTKSNIFIISPVQKLMKEVLNKGVIKGILKYSKIIKIVQFS